MKRFVALLYLASLSSAAAAVPATKPALTLASSSRTTTPQKEVLRTSTHKAIFGVSGGALGRKFGKKAVTKVNNPNGASIPNEVFNLVKGIVGVGVLSLPAGIAAFADAKSAFLPAAAIIAVIGILSAYGFGTSSLLLSRLHSNSSSSSF